MLTITDLSKSYGDRIVLDHLNLTINVGEVYGLLGPNGAGKTTVINLICNLLKPDSGIIKINEKSLSQKTKSWLGVAPQENLLYRTLTCQENLDFYGKIYGLKSSERKSRIELCLQAVNLLDRAKSPVENLSGGMQRRLNIAVAMIHQPKLLILDEPTTGLDIEARYDIWQLIQNLQQQGITILLTTHLLDEAQRLCQKIGILKSGKLLAEGSLDELQQLIPAKEVLTIKTSEEKKVLERAKNLGLIHRRHGRDLCFWLPEPLELREVLDLFQGIMIDSIARQPVQLEHIYLEVTQEKFISH
jgi:ABC-2 type transport system ATP-binding protein